MPDLKGNAHIIKKPLEIKIFTKFLMVLFCFYAKAFLILEIASINCSSLVA
jgi:hypothetical protein